MGFLYYAAVAATLLLFLHYLLSDFRRAILIGLVLTTFTLAALPWHLVPFDAAAFACQVGFLMVALTWFLVRKNNVIAIRLALNGYLLGLFALEFVLVVYLLISKSSGYGTSLVVWLLVKSILPVLAFGFLAPFDSIDIRLISNVVLVGSTLTALRLFSTNAGATSSEDLVRVSLGIESSPITVARVIGLGAALLIALLLLGRERNPVKTAARLALAGLLFSGIAATGSRGPLFAAILVVFATFVFLGHGPGMRRRIGLSLALALVLLTAMALLLPSNVWEYGGIQRIFDRLLTFGSNASDRARLALFETAWSGFLASSGIGVGTGGFEALYYLPGYYYPHNLILEVAVSHGVVGLSLLLFLLAATLSQVVRLSRQLDLDVNLRPLMALWFYSFFNAMVSMDIAGNHALWVSGGLVWLLSPSVVRDANRKTQSELGRVV